MGGCLPAPASWASPWVLSSASPATPATVEVRTATTPALQVSSERGRRAAPGDSPAGSQHCPAGPRCPRVQTRGKMCSLKILTTCINFSVAKGVHHFTKFWNFSLWTPRTLTRHHDPRSACAPSSRARPAWCVGSRLGCGLPWQTGPEFPRSQPAAVGPPRCPDTASPAACPPGLYLSNTVIKRVGAWPRAGPRNKIQKAQQLPLEHGARDPVREAGGQTRPSRP